MESSKFLKVLAVYGSGSGSGSGRQDICGAAGISVPGLAVVKLAMDNSVLHWNSDVKL